MAGYLRGETPLSFVVVMERGGTGYTQAGGVANAVLQRAKELYEHD